MPIEGGPRAQDAWCRAVSTCRLRGTELPPPAKNSPSGTLTLVFTDIQNSTELWEKLGGDFERWLGQHNRILRERLAACGGYEVKTEGDAFMIAFTHARDAVRFALETQEALHAAGWPPEIGEMLVRMGIHTGEPLLTNGRYVGLAVHRAARICAAAYGGQILVSGTTADVIQDDVDDVALGEERNPLRVVAHDADIAELVRGAG